MSGVIRRPFGRLRRRAAGEVGDHGGVAAIVAIFLASGVLFGMGALVVDIGQLYAEREQLQSSADAASYKVALSCAKGDTCSTAAQLPTARTYAKLNSKDGFVDTQICFNDTGCPTWNTAITCPPQPAPAAGTTNGSWVEVRTTTLNQSGTTLVPPTFAGALTGTNYKGKKVGTCARVNWGTPITGKVLALGISLCDWKRMTSNGTVFYGPLGTLLNDIGLFPMLGLPKATSGIDSAIPQVLPLSAFNLPMPSCTTPVNLTVPRGYVWLGNNDLSPPDSECMIDVNVGDSPRSFVLSGLLVGTYCAAKLTALRNAGAPVLVPIFDVIQPAVLTLAPAYHIVGFAPFVITGNTGLLGGLLGGAVSVLTGGLLNALASILCGASSCIYGYFTNVLTPASRPRFGTGPNYGATVIGRTG